MPWVRLDEHAMEHPKVAGLPDGAFRLWVAGLAYCQKFLTDGVISDVALRGLRGFTSRRRDDLVVAGLWDAAESGITVHDYLDWNVSREHVLNSREQSRERLKKHKEKRVSNAVKNAHPTVGGCSEVFGSSSGERGVGKTPSADLSQRAGAFCEWYADTHLRLFGIGYIGANKDYTKACELCAVFSDADLRDAALVWFGQDDDFALDGTRTIVKFAPRATGCLQRARRRVAAV